MTESEIQDIDLAIALEPEVKKPKKKKRRKRRKASVCEPKECWRLHGQRVCTEVR